MCITYYINYFIKGDNKMKKEWQKPEIKNLSLKETKGGPNWDPKADGDAIYDPNTNKWWTPSGRS